MNILFLTTGRLNNIEEHSLYPDLLREFRNHGHNVYSVSAYERRTGKSTEYKCESGVYALRVRVGNITKCGVVEKGISTLLIEYQYKRAIIKYLSDVKFDLVLYSTPPITLVKVIEYIKKQDGARSYLLLKDIFPQNAVDLGMLSKNGLKNILYSYFRNKEKKLYKMSDRIGCMSQANCDYLNFHNSYLDSAKIEICPNCIEVQDVRLNDDEKQKMRLKYGIPLDKKVFVYGGNLGKPQGIPFVIECLKTQEDNKEVFFLIVGDGTEFGKLEAYFENAKPTNMKLMKRLPKEDYDSMIAACDIGMIFLDYRFTIPNFPSRLLAYMQAGLPILACTDSCTDIGKVIVEGGFGWWCESNDKEAFKSLINTTIDSDFEDMVRKEKEWLLNNYTTEQAYHVIMK